MGLTVTGLTCDRCETSAIESFFPYSYSVQVLPFALCSPFAGNIPSSDSADYKKFAIARNLLLLERYSESHPIVTPSSG